MAKRQINTHPSTQSRNIEEDELVAPTILLPLITYLDKIFPNTLEGVSKENLEYRKGGREVVDHLRSLFSSQHNP